MHLLLYFGSKANISMRNMPLMYFGNLFNVWTYFRETNPHFFCSTKELRSFFDLVLLSVKNPLSHKYAVENFIKRVKAFLASDGCSSLIAIQNVSVGNSACLILCPQSLEKHSDFSSSHN